MKRFLKTSLLVGAALLGGLSSSAQAAPALRFQVDQKGDFVLLGKTMGFDCAAGVGIPAPVVGSVGMCGNNTGDSAMDVYWRADSPGVGQATADTAITAAQARTTAILNLPAGASVTKAFMYWGAKLDPPGTNDEQVTLDRQGGFSAVVSAITTYNLNPQANLFFYQSVADVTAIIQQQGPGAYRVSGIDSGALPNFSDNFAYAGWWMAVFYTSPNDPPRNLALFDGLDVVSGAPVAANISGFLVPNAGFDGKLGVIAFEGDATNSGDQLFFKGNALSDAQNPINNFFNNSRSNLGVAVSNAGDLPQLTGEPNSLAGLDLDVIDITTYLVGGDMAAQIQATSTTDSYFLGGFVTSISTFKPDFSGSGKSAVDLNGGGLLPGDVIEYTVVAINNGNDTSVNTVLTDVLPAGVTYLPGSLQITAGANIGAKTDGPLDDQAEYNLVTNTITVRLGAGANGLLGGTVAVGASSTVKFKVTVNANASGSIQNQASISAAGQQGAPVSVAVTDGNGPVAGAPPTVVVIDQCGTDADCVVAGKPHCFTTPDPNVCVECFLDNQCGALTPTCNLVSNTCTCVPTGVEICGNNTDEDCSGAIDNGCGCMIDADCGGLNSGKICNAANICVPGCRGMNGNGCPVGDVCTSMDASIGQCVDCLVDANCGGPTSATVCNTVTNLCIPGCRGMNGNGCMPGDFCTSMDATIGECVGCLVDADCGGPMSAIVCNAAHACVPGCRGMNGNGCMAGNVCTSMDATIGQCIQCVTDSDCGGPMSAKVCDAATNTCEDGCRGMNGNGCAAGDVCTSVDATIGACVDCTTDADCGGPMSAKVCDAASNTCKDGCRGMNGNGCMAGDVCTSVDATIGICVQCLTDSDCGGPMSAKVCDGMACKDGCRGMNGNGCMAGDVCTSVDATVGQCVDCLVDADCGGPMSARVCDGMVCKDGCRGMNGNGCMAGKDCTSKDATIGVCVECLTDSECGNAKSGKVCDDATHMCGPGCRGMNGNGCPDGQSCSSIDATIGSCSSCATDADCGAADSGTVCDDTSKTCVPGCRGMNGNGCGGALKCTSLTTTVGACVGCASDADCGAKDSARVCDASTKACIDGCRGKDGNTCASTDVCSSTTADIGTCSLGDEVVAQGNGILCSTRPGNDGGESSPWLFGSALGLVLAWRRRRRAA